MRSLVALLSGCGYPQVHGVHLTNVEVGNVHLNPRFLPTDTGRNLRFASKIPLIANNAVHDLNEPFHTEV